LRLKERWSALKESKALTFIRNRYLITGALFLIWVLFLDSGSAKEWLKVIRRIGVQESQKREYKESIRQIDEKLHELSSNKDSLEKFAREQYLFKEDDEDIFIIEVTP